MLSPVPATLLVALASIASAAKLPSYIKPCKADRKLNECALKRGREIIPFLVPGDPSLRIPVLEPLLLDRVDLKPTGSLDLRLSCYNCHVHGLSKAKLLDISLDLRKRHISLKLKIPKLMVTGKYDVVGKVLLFPITGKGVSNITLNDVDVEAALDYRLYKKKKEEYGQAIKHHVKFDANGFRIHLTNLFNGDKLLVTSHCKHILSSGSSLFLAVLCIIAVKNDCGLKNPDNHTDAGDNMNLILNENWREVLNDLKPSISTTVGQIIVTIINQIFELIPYSQFFIKN